MDGGKLSVRIEPDFSGFAPALAAELRRLADEIDPPVDGQQA